MLYNFIVGYTASFLSKLIGRSVSDLESESYNLTELSGQDENGYYYNKDNEGNLCRIGFYLTRYNNELWNRSPSLHLELCDNLKELKHLMRATNSQYVTYYSKDNLKTYKNQRLSICKKCLKLLKNKTSILMTGTSFNEFILTLEENEELKCKIHNKDGYSINWPQISKAFREIKEYTCEVCFYKLENLEFTRFFQTHHIDSYNKMNNKRNNLKCLCVKCHSEVDDYHRTQFQSIENQLLLSEFEAFLLNSKSSRS